MMSAGRVGGADADSHPGLHPPSIFGLFIKILNLVRRPDTRTTDNILDNLTDPMIMTFRTAAANAS